MAWARSHPYKTPVYYAQQLYATMAGDRPLKIVSSVPADAGPDLSANRARTGDAVILLAVNDSLNSISRPLDFSAFGPANGGDGQTVEVWTLGDTKNAGEPDVTNSFA